ncbi:MAG: hypothetical protein WD801_12770 [Gemmatimonadaceae bacterium]
MKAPPDPSWQQTWRELRLLAWAILLIDLIAIGLGFLAARPMGSSAPKVGVGLAVFVTVCFTVLIGGNLLAAWLMWWWRKRSAP